MKNFDGLGLNPTLVQSLTRMEYTTPTPIQAQAIPLALKGRDIMGSAQTGTGKTAAFSIPLVEHLLNSPSSSAIVLMPTRELAKQVMDVMHQLLGPKSPIKTAFLIGGEPMGKQYAQIQRRPRLIIGTPGRINDHLKRNNLDLHLTDFVVLDETDRMLDMGFSIQIDEIIKHLPEKRQTLMFSATLPKNIMEMSKNYLNDPERIAVGSTSNPAKNIKQSIIRVNDDGKYAELTRELHTREGSVVLFVKTKRAADRIAKRLNEDGFSADAIHGDLNQRKRDRVIREYRTKNFRILVATDVAARGLDIPHIEHVINYDMPQVPEDYIHRIGRTARAGAQGEALCLISPADGRKWHAIEMLMNPDMKKDEKTSSPHNSSHKKPRRKPQGKSQAKPQGKSQSKPQGKSQEKPQAKPQTKPQGKSQGKPQGKPHSKHGKPVAQPSKNRGQKKSNGAKKAYSGAPRPHKKQRKGKPQKAA